MFAIRCSTCRVRSLLFAGDIHGIANTPAGIEVHYRCLRGHDGVALTGRRSRRHGGADVATA